MTTLDYADAIDLVSAIRTRRLSPVEVLEDVLQRAERLQPILHPFVTIDAERASAAARDAEAAVMRGEPLGPLHGLPVAVKDLEPTAGLRTTYGSKFFEDHVPDIDGAVAGRLRAAGAILFAKTNTPHFGYKDMCDNLLGPPTRNPWRLDRTPGGSSGGAAAAVAAGIGSLAHGSDGAGSIRIPAALCGVFGFKPSFGLVPYWPNPDFWAARSHHGPLARTVRDGALMLDAVAGADPRDPLSLDLPPRDWLAACEEPELKGLRVAWSPDFGYAAVDSEVRRITSAAAARFGDLGCTVEEVNPGWDDPSPWAALLWDFNLAARNIEHATQRPEWIEPSMRDMIDHGRRATSMEVGRAQLARSTFYEQALGFMRSYDLLLTPQMPCAAWSIEQWPREIDGRPTPNMFDHLPFTYPFNLTGWPAATLPCGFTTEGLPVALQVVAGWHQDALCLRAAAAFEALQPWAHRHPDIASY
ncbi:MAG TPA: amidase family protein [Chloroflexota bacterium]|nr:amidase family protein [Chloroflexota bacterium]